MNQHGDSYQTCGEARRCRDGALLLLVWLLLAIHGALLACESKFDSPTWDEFGHIAAGVSHWKTGSFDLYPVNPPLVRMVATALPIYFYPKLNECVHADQGGTTAAFSLASFIVKELGAEFFDVVFIARLACIPFSILGGFVCYRWSRDLFGARSGITALLLWCISPTILGYGHLMTPDVGATACGLSATYAFWRWLRTKHWTWCVAAGFLLGLALLAKFTLLVLLFCWPFLWIIWHAATRFRDVRGNSVPQWGALLLTALITINAGYGFEGSFERLGESPFISKWLRATDTGTATPRLFQRNRFSESVFGRVAVPLPRNYLMGIDRQAFEFEREFWSYLRGEWRQRGWWYYYLYAWFIKEPLGTWCLAALMLCRLMWTRWHKGRIGLTPNTDVSWRDWMTLLSPPLAVLVLVSSQTGFNHHLRYILPAFPFVFIALSATANWICRQRPVVTSVVVLSCVWSVIGSLWYFPHSLSYFNELVGGPLGGPHHLSDSNIDWGQDLFHLKQWSRDHPEARPLRVTYVLNSLLDPRLVEASFEPYVPQENAAGVPLQPEPGWYAVSVCPLFRLDSHCAEFRQLQPVGRAGFGIYIYHVLENPVNRVDTRIGSLEASATRSGP